MGVEIRAARSEEMEEFQRVFSTSLLMPPRPSAENRISPEWTLCAFEDGKLATAYAALPLTIQVNGEGIPVAGVNNVGTLPIYRRRGYLRQISTTHFELLHERGEQPIAILFATQAAIYQRYGYAIVSTHNSYSVEPRDLKFSTAQPVSGTFREVGDNELELLDDLYRRFRAEKTGYIHRNRSSWENGPLSPPRTEGMLAKLVYEEAGQPLGYLLYTVESPPGGVSRPGQHLISIRDLVWLTASTYRAVWNYFAHMDLVHNITWRRVPTDDPLPHLLLEPSRLNIASHDGIFARIVDVERVLPKRRYYEEGTLTFEILDDLCSWNCGQWKLETSTTETSISRTTEKPQLSIPISTLAMLFFGQISATEAARMERLNVLMDSTLPLWDGVMRTAYRPFCPDIF